MGPPDSPAQPGALPSLVCEAVKTRWNILLLLQSRYARYSWSRPFSSRFQECELSSGPKMNEADGQHRHQQLPDHSRIHRDRDNKCDMPRIASPTLHARLSVSPGRLPRPPPISTVLSWQAIIGRQAGSVNVSLKPPALTGDRAMAH